MASKIPCTVAVLTFNNAGTLGRALESVKDFAEVIVCDGGSVDNTIEIAQQHGSRILLQEPRFKDKSGRIIDFAGVRNETFSAATHEWFAYLDSDEVFTPELVEEMRSAIKENKPAAFWVDRKYEIEGKVIECAATYPTRQMRFFHKTAVTNFIKPIHERVNPKPDALVKTTENFMLVPVSATPLVWRKKWKYYIELEVSRRGKLSFTDWLLVCAENLKVSSLYLFRYGRNLIFCRGTKMPWALEWERHVYHWNLCKALRSIVS